MYFHRLIHIFTVIYFFSSKKLGYPQNLRTGYFALIPFQILKSLLGVFPLFQDFLQLHYSLHQYRFLNYKAPQGRSFFTSSHSVQPLPLGTHAVGKNLRDVNPNDRAGGRPEEEQIADEKPHQRGVISRRTAVGSAALAFTAASGLSVDTKANEGPNRGACKLNWIVGIFVPRIIGFVCFTLCSAPTRGFSAPRGSLGSWVGASRFRAS